MYENLEKSKIFESEKNKLTFDMEIEAMYLVGDFGVKGVGIFEEIPEKATSFEGNFVLTAPAKTVTLTNIEQQGFLFFSGELTVEKTVTLAAKDTARVLNFCKFGTNAIRISVNGKAVTTVMWAPYSVDLTPYLQAGDNTVSLTLVGNLRNLLGPHHHMVGELLGVAPPHFYNEPCIWNGYAGGYFTDKYSFVHVGLAE